MLDNLRDQTSFQPEEEELYPSASSLDKPPKPKKRGRSLDQITGMTGPQRFILSAMLFVMVCLLGMLLSIVTGKIILPIAY